MTRLLTRAFAELEKLPADRQDEMAAMLLDLMAGDKADFTLSPEQEAGLRSAIEQANRGEFATREDMDSLFAKYGA